MITVRTSHGNNLRNERTTFPHVVARQERAKERQAYRATLSPAQQLATLDLRLGKDVGAQRERARLLALIATPPKTPEPVATPEVEKAPKPKFKKGQKQP